MNGTCVEGGVVMRPVSRLSQEVAIYLGLIPNTGLWNCAGWLGMEGFA
jgi:hypothetical protein